MRGFLKKHEEAVGEMDGSKTGNNSKRMKFPRANGGLTEKITIFAVCKQVDSFRLTATATTTKPTIDDAPRN